MPEINIIEEGKKLFDVEIAAMEAVKNALDERFEKIVKLICDCKGKVVITGMGKPGHIGTKIAATMASLGTPSFFLHPAEAQHGDLGNSSSSYFESDSCNLRLTTLFHGFLSDEFVFFHLNTEVQACFKR